MPCSYATTGDTIIGNPVYGFEPSVRVGQHKEFAFGYDRSRFGIRHSPEPESRPLFADCSRRLVGADLATTGNSARRRCIVRQ